MRGSKIKTKTKDRPWIPPFFKNVIVCHSVFKSIIIIIPRMDTVEWFLWQQSTILHSVVSWNSFSTQNSFLLLFYISIYFLRRSFFGEFLYLHVLGCVYVCCKHSTIAVKCLFSNIHWPFETGNLFRATFHIFGMLWNYVEIFWAYRPNTILRPIHIHEIHTNHHRFSSRAKSTTEKWRQHIKSFSQSAFLTISSILWLLFIHSFFACFLHFHSIDRAIARFSCTLNTKHIYTDNNNTMHMYAAREYDHHWSSVNSNIPFGWTTKFMRFEWNLHAIYTRFWVLWF